MNLLLRKKSGSWSSMEMFSLATELNRLIISYDGKMTLLLHEMPHSKISKALAHNEFTSERI